jgi:hypothetical protein
MAAGKVFGRAARTQALRVEAVTGGVKPGPRAESTSFPDLRFQDSRAWMAVMAMSSTSEPRDKSLPGRLSPWSTGPMLMTLTLRWTA